MKMPIEIWIRRRGSKRSASAPEYTERNRNGSQCISTAVPASAGERNFSNRIQ